LEEEEQQQEEWEESAERVARALALPPLMKGPLPQRKWVPRRRRNGLGFPLPWSVPQQLHYCWEQQKQHH